MASLEIECGVIKDSYDSHCEVTFYGDIDALVGVLMEFTFMGVSNIFEHIYKPKTVIIYFNNV